VSLIVQDICNHIRLSLAHIQIGLSENVPQAFVVGVDVDHIPKKIVASCLQSKDNVNQLEIMCGMVLLMTS
jgi:hypothetical protein